VVTSDPIACKRGELSALAKRIHHDAMYPGHRTDTSVSLKNTWCTAIGVQGREKPNLRVASTGSQRKLYSNARVVVGTGSSIFSPGGDGASIFFHNEPQLRLTESMYNTCE